jgi:amino acid permease
VVLVVVVGFCSFMSALMLTTTAKHVGKLGYETLARLGFGMVGSAVVQISFILFLFGSCTGWLGTLLEL